jgi:crotonobetainyl-CoA:carnitine CoA-transferase CaiB-like acyl-CoA transferase
MLVIDLTDRRGWLAGRILADLGATVVKVEQPGGDPDREDRRVAPSISGGGPNPAWLAYNRGKRSVTLDLASPVGRGLLLRLVRKADVVIESSAPGSMARLGLGYSDMAAVNPSLVATSISPFGQTGPYAGWAATDLTVGAMGGAVWPTGDPDRPPLRIGTDQYFLHASAEAALHTIVGAYHAARSGQGQHVDVSAQLAAVRTLMNAACGPYTDGTAVHRAKFGEPTERSPYRVLYQCADGYVMASLTFGPGVGGIVQWLREDDALPASLDSLTPEQLASPTVATDMTGFPAQLNTAVAQMFGRYPKRKLADDALARRIMLLPINNAADLLQDEQLTARDFFAEVDYHGAGALVTPWQWVKATATPLAPAMGTTGPGADNTEIWSQLAGLTLDELAEHRLTGVI